MLDQLARLNSDHLTFLAIMAGLVLAALTLLGSTLIVQIRQFRQRQLELGFREEMLRRGHSIDEISQLLNPSRRTSPQSVAVQADGLAGRLGAAFRRLAAWAPEAFQRCRRRLRPFSNRGAALCRKGLQNAKRFTVQAWQDARPLVRRARTAISRCAGLLSNALHTLSQRLAPQRP